MSIIPTTDDNTQKVTPITGRITTLDFWAELVVKQGVSAAIALYLVYSITGQQREAISRVENAVYSIGLKLDTLSDKLNNTRVNTAPPENRNR